MSHKPSTIRPSVIIAGAGVGGLTLGALLEQIDIPYQIHERAKEIRPLGSAISLGANILPVFQQLGLYEDLKSLSQPYGVFHVYNADMSSIGSISSDFQKAATGYDLFLVPRPELYELLLRKIPAHKIKLGSNVLHIEEKESKVIVHCSDDAKYEADILVGADGAYSAVRQSLYKLMDEKGILPKEDLKGLNDCHIAMVGVAKTSNPDKYPQLSEGRTNFHQVVGENGRDWYVINTSKDEICWGIGIKIPESEIEAQQFRNSEWGPEGIDTMANEFRDSLCPIGGTMGEIFDATPKHLTSKVFLSEKNFETWFHGRTVLLGDGAVMAMQDAVVLANGLYRLTDESLESITTVFEDYYKIHHPDAEQRIKNGRHATKIMNGQTWQAKLTRYVTLNLIPEWLLKRLYKKEHAYRPQIAWLPAITA
ncbi:hypothetical protein BGX27_000496 [Mortierella sp. AM989]|nr:hypothetical protein BGX27_000496 [Mortierella sp. AM989]